MSSGYTNDIYIAGPLNLNRATKQADTAMGTHIELKPKDFEALDLLATNLGKYISFDALYNAAWGTSKETANFNYAKASLNTMIFQINTTGNKFMQIESDHDDNYKLVTHWGNSWKNRNSTVQYETSISEYYTDNIQNTIGQRKEDRKRRFIYKTLLSGAGAIAVAVIVALILYIAGVISLGATEPLYIDVEDPGVPLANPILHD